jgi:hypothetical protein
MALEDWEGVSWATGGERMVQTKGMVICKYVCMRD